MLVLALAVAGGTLGALLLAGLACALIMRRQGTQEAYAELHEESPAGVDAPHEPPAPATPTKPHNDSFVAPLPRTPVRLVQCQDGDGGGDGDGDEEDPIALEPVQEEEDGERDVVPPKVRHLKAWWRGIGLGEVLWNGSARATHYVVTWTDHQLGSDEPIQTRSRECTQTIVMLELDAGKYYTIEVRAVNKHNQSEPTLVELGRCDIDLGHEESAVDKLVERIGRVLTVTKLDRNKYAFAREVVNLALRSEGHGQVCCRVGGGFVELSAWLVRHKGKIGRYIEANPETPPRQAAQKARPAPQLHNARSRVVQRRASAK